MKAPAEDGDTGHDAAHRPRTGERASGERASEQPAVDAAHPRTRPLSVATAQRLQGAAGNRAVARLVAQRRTQKAPAAQPRSTGATGLTGATGPAASTGPSSAALPAQAAAPAVAEPVALQRFDRGGPGTDPKFAALKADVHRKQQVLTAHPPATAEAAAAQSAAKAPQDDREARGKAANAATMDAAKPGEFDKAGFVRAVNDAIAAQAPKNLDEADSFGLSGKAGAVKDQVAGKVTDGRKRAARVGDEGAAGHVQGCRHGRHAAAAGPAAAAARHARSGQGRAGPGAAHGHRLLRRRSSRTRSASSATSSPRSARACTPSWRTSAPT